MPSANEINENLGVIENWHFVHNKKVILKTLSKILDNDEAVQDLLDGMYLSSEIRKEISGVVFVTDQRIIFISNDKKNLSHQAVTFDEIKDISYVKGFSTVKIEIELISGRIVFNALISGMRAQKFIKQMRGISSTELASKQNEIDTVLNDLKKFSENENPMPKFLKKISGIEKNLSDQLEKAINKEDEMENLNFLFHEAKKIHSQLSEYIDFNSDDKLIQFIIDDLIILSSLCSIADGSLSDEELIFISLVLIYFNPHKSEKTAGLAEKIFSTGSFPEKYKDDLIEYWNRVSEYMKERNISMENNILPSLQYIKNYDNKNGTLHSHKIVSAYNTFTQCLMKADGSITSKEEDRLKQIGQLIYQSEEAADDIEVEAEAAEEETLESVMEGINTLIGMENIKGEIQTFINLVKVQKKREERGLPVTPFSLHAVFYGPPGTGKTTIARLLGKVYKCLGLLEKGHLIETDRAGLVAGYVGQTATRVDEVVQNALDGVLFIDEAYALSPRDGHKDFGQEAIDTLLKRMEDNRGRLAVIAAGYPDEMEYFIKSNPGLKSRFSRYFYFDHYKPEELIQIFDIFSGNVSFNVSDKAREKLLNLLRDCYENRERSFGNGRLVRNLFEKIVEKQANRIADIIPLTDEILCTITEEDVPDDTGNITFELNG